MREKDGRTFQARKEVLPWETIQQFKRGKKSVDKTGFDVY
jgi:hypothetical protein